MTDSKKYILADGCQEILDQYVYEFIKNEQTALKGDIHVFDEVYKPILNQQGVSFVNMAVGGERTPQVLYSNTDKLRFWDAHKKLDVLNSELEAGCQSFVLCKTAWDIDRAIEEGKFAIVATLSGGKPLEGKPNLNLLSSLRSLYRMGLRGLQLTGNTRNRLADGVGQDRTKGKLTGFGRQVVEEANRLGMLLDTAQLSDYGFFDLVELTDNPVIDSHSCTKGVYDHPQNLSDDRIKKIAETGGVVALSFWSSLVAGDKDKPTVDDLLDHVDYIVKLVGVDHVALGPNYSAYETPVDREAVKGFGNLGPDYCEMDRLTPLMSEKYPGWIDGVWYGTRESDFIEGPNTHETFSLIITALEKRGYDQASCEKILGGNMIRVYKAVLK